MASRVYSETFIRAASVGAHVFSVPYGKRAVVKQLEAVSFVGAGATLTIQAAGVYLAYWQLAAAIATRQHSTFAVVYGGQTIVASISESGIHTHVSGFLFDDPVGAEAEPLTTVEDL